MAAEDRQTESAFPGVFDTPLELRWRDQDALGHVNNVTYFRYFEEARVHLFAQLDRASSRQRVWLLAHASCDFLKPLLYPERIVVGLRLARLGRTSLELDAAIRSAVSGLVYARGRNIVVGADVQTGRPIAWDAADRALLAQLFAAPQ